MKALFFRGLNPTKSKSNSRLRGGARNDTVTTVLRSNTDSSQWRARGAFHGAFIVRRFSETCLLGAAAAAAVLSVVCSPRSIQCCCHPFTQVYIPYTWIPFWVKENTVNGFA